MFRRFEWNEGTRAIAVGVAVTLAATAALWTIPWLYLWYYSDQAFVYLDAPTYRSYRLLGGVFGGLATGLFSELNDPAGLRGAYAGVIGAVGIGIGYFVVTLVVDTLAVYSTPPIAYVSVMTILVLLPLLPSFAIGGFVGGIVGREARDLGSDVVERVSR